MTTATANANGHRLKQQAELLNVAHRQLLAAASHSYAEGILQEAENVLYTHLPEAEPVFHDLHQSMEQRRWQSEKGFTIALFGRTGAGKSTLTAILTQNDQPVIGKGAQRTTRETVEYRWDNLLVLDTPGIAAAHHDGQDDTLQALAAADSADLIVFIATEDSPQPAEAQCLAELHRRGKDLLALMNCKQTIASPEDCAEFLNHPEMTFNDQDLADRQHQFDELVSQYSSKTPPRFQQAHFQSILATQRTEDPEQNARLSAASHLLPTLKYIKEKAARHSSRSAVKTPPDLLLPTIQEQSREMLAHSQILDAQKEAFSKGIKELESWLPQFKKDAIQQAELRITEQLRPLRQSIPQFAEEYAEKKDIESVWKGRVTRATKDNKTFQNLVDSWVETLNKRAERAAEKITANMRFNKEHAQWFTINKDKIFDFKRWFKWSSGLSAAAIGVVPFALALTGPIGWVIGGIAAAVGLIGQFFGKSKKDKLQERAAEIRRELNQHVYQVAQHYRDELRKQLDDLTSKFSDALRQAHWENQQNQAAAKKYANAGSNLRTLLQQEHMKLAQRLLSLESNDQELTNGIHALGRIPGQETILMPQPNTQINSSTKKLLEEVLNEPIEVIAYSQDPADILRQCLKEPNLQVTVNLNSRTAVIPKENPDIKRLQRIHAAELLADLYISWEKE